MLLVVLLIIGVIIAPFFVEPPHQTRVIEAEASLDLETVLGRE